MIKKLFMWGLMLLGAYLTLDYLASKFDIFKGAKNKVEVIIEDARDAVNDSVEEIEDEFEDYIDEESQGIKKDINKLKELNAPPRLIDRHKIKLKKYFQDKKSGKLTSTKKDDDSQ